MKTPFNLESYLVNGVENIVSGILKATLYYNGPQKRNHLIEIYREHGILK